ncbi:hypothetical protein CXF68_14140 [Tenacibaculum sp. Bg11-29]|uniref:hypothetical protein n=1 Tax=Tenacibaculum sp. Bg11-29 TaxID=2058306 RepID=UPI000C328E7A|nr:hypothetical protein [Tenacibaculum sp. Bg11-29]PKH51753.1 hypothetical protein CXF68_14140 [Tenacibaculum sp. Bg11-29]
MQEQISETFEGTTFSNKDSSEECKNLYTNTTQKIEAWSAVLLPSTSSFDNEIISLSEVSTQNGYYIFANGAPIDPSNFIRKIRTYIGENLTLIWILEIESNFSISNVIKMDLFNKEPGLIVMQPFTYKVGNDFAQLSIANNTVISFVPEDAPTQMKFAYDSSISNFFFTSTEIGTQSLFNQDIFLPFSTEGNGALKFKLGLNSETFYEAFMLQNTFYYKDTESDAILSNVYPILQPSEVPNEYLMSQTAIDPLDITNSKGINTYFALTGVTFNNTSKLNTQTNVSSYYATNAGYPINLLPSASWKDDNDQNNLIPSDITPRFVIAPQDKDGSLRYFMQIDGNFFLTPQGGDADENGKFDFLLGLSGTETLLFTPYSLENNMGDILQFKSLQPAFAANFPSTSTTLDNPGSYALTLSPEYCTFWANLISITGEAVQYCAQAEGAALFAKGHGITNKIYGKPNLLGFYEPSVDMPSTIHVPMVPYLGISILDENIPVKQYSKFESEVLSKERKEQITKVKPTARASKSTRKLNTMLSEGETSFTSSTTPQGVIAHVNNSGSWGLLNLAQNNLAQPPAHTQYISPEGQVPTDPSQYQMSFINLSDTLQQGFMTNQQFLVVTQNNYLGKLFSEFKGNVPITGTIEAYFNNKMSIEDWPFNVNVGTTNTFADYNNILIFKFCKGTLKDWAQDPKIWTQPNTFNTEGISDPAEAYQQTVAISSWIQNYIAEAEAAYAYGEKYPESNQVVLYQKFIDTINNPNWNGILALKVDIDLQEFPQQLKGLISGINLDNFYGHHIGIEVNKVNASGEIEMEKNSSIFSLINYLDPAYTQQITQGLNVDAPIMSTPGVDYEFKVLQLQVLFENTAIKFFQSKVQLTMNKLFSDTVVGTNNPYATTGNNSVVLNGTYQDHDGTPVYIFENTDDNLYYFDSNLLKNVEITKIQFNTLTTDPDAVIIDSRFTMWGYLNYAVMTGLIYPDDDSGDDPMTSYFDAFSFGNSDGGVDNETNIQKGLNYNNLFISMSFDITIPSVVTYGFDATQIVFNSNSSISRSGSLYPNFALQINNLVSGNADVLPASFGYLNLSVPALDISGVSNNWYGLEMTLNMGSPGELAASMDFNASLLMAWSPGATSVDDSYNVFFGIKLPGTSSDAKLLSLQGILKLSIDTLKMEFIPEDNATPELGSFMMTLGNIALKFLGIAQLPPGGSTNFLLFGNPKKGATSKSLGWYASYNKTT